MNPHDLAELVAFVIVEAYASKGNPFILTAQLQVNNRVQNHIQTWKRPPPDLLQAASSHHGERP